MITLQDADRAVTKTIPDDVAPTHYYGYMFNRPLTETELDWLYSENDYGPSQPGGSFGRMTSFCTKRRTLVTVRESFDI